MSKRKILLLAAMLCMIAILAVGGTLAYFTADDSATNTFTVGNVAIDLTEPKWDEQGSEDAPEVYPGEALAKDPTVENTGANPCFVRVQVTNLDQFVATYGADAMIDLRYIKDGVYQDGYNTDDWTYYEGYYYYNKVLATEADAGNEYNVGLTNITTPVFSQIVMPVELTNSAETKAIEVTAQAVQAQGAKPSYTAVKAMTVEEIAAWFETCMATAK